MKRLFLAALMLLALAVPAVAQLPTGYRLRMYFWNLEGETDSAYVVPSGGSFDAELYGYDNLGRGVGSFTFRIYYDPARISFVSARSSCPDSLTYPLQTPVVGPNYVELSASGCVTPQTWYSHRLATVRFQLQAGATTGSSLYVEPRAVTDRLATDRTGDGEGDLDQVCRAVGAWGDVDDDAMVNSRDALIALSNAVGLPTPGFLVNRGDVDSDGYVGSRDALAMLSASIGYAPAYGFRTGKGIAVACAPQAMFTRALYFVRHGSGTSIPGVSGLAIRSANDSSVVVVGDSINGHNANRVRVSPDGSRIAFVCLWQGYYQICTANADGSGLANISGAFTTDVSPDWSPDGTQIVFLRSSQIWTMNADGSNQQAVPATPSSVVGVAWDPRTGSRRIAYTHNISYGELRTREIDSATTDSLVFAGTNPLAYPASPEWSPAGDSLVLSLYADGAYNAWFLGRSGGTPVRAVTLESDYARYAAPVWTDQGIIFSQYQSYPAPTLRRLIVRRPNGMVELIRKDVVDNHVPGMDRQ